MRRLVVLPLLVVALVVAVPFVAGDHPLEWSRVEDAAFEQAGRLPAGARALLPLAGPRPQYAAAVPAAGGTQAVPTLRPVLSRYPVDTVDGVWRPGTAQLGVQVYWVSNPRDREKDVWGKAQRVVDYVVGLKANAIAVSFPAYMTRIDGTQVLPGPGTPPPDRVEILVRQAHAAGLRVTLRPLLDEAALGPPKGWRGNIAPASTDAWFASYRTLLAPYLDVARRRGVATVVLGAELNSMEPATAQWTALADWARGHFPGELGYDLNWDNYIVGKYPLGAASRYGIDAYFPVFTDDAAPSSVIARSWVRTLTTAPPGPPGPLVLSEVAISAKLGAYQYPAAFSGVGTYDDRIQPTWFRGVCAAAREQRLAGLYFWKVDFDADPSRPPVMRTDRPNLDFLGQPKAETAIRECLGAPWTVAAG